MYRLKKLIIILIGIFIGLIPGLSGATTPLNNFTTQPEFLFIKEDRQVLFSVKYQGTTPPPETLTLAELTNDESQVRFVWSVNDDGTKGDEIAGDGIYSRKIYFKEKKTSKTPLHYSS